MKRKLLYFSLLIFSFSLCHSQSQLYFENFETGGATFTINSTNSWNNTGNNKWIINNDYTGAIGHPSTISEDSTFGGSISYAPYGHYLHIYDSASGFLNDNFNPADSSDRFANIIAGICTKAMTNVNFNFFYLCDGSANAYGSVYYSVNGGPWTQTGNILDNKYKWQYTTITNPAFNNVEDLRFGFRWINKNNSGHDTTGLGIDDVSIYGTYDSINHPITCTFTTQNVDSCLGGNAYIFVSAQFSDSTCGSNWDLDVSNGNGNFSPPIAVFTYSISPAYGNDIYDNSLYAPIPANYHTPGSCFKVRINRLSYPYLTFIDSVCFPLDTCPGFITTLQPPVTLDTNPVCAGSVIDIPFNSTGVYNVTNIYYAQLLDSIGIPIDTLGSLTSSASYPTFPAGDISGFIPLTVKAGCKYSVRVVSSNPSLTGTTYGPFCIQHCDILSNGQQSVHACLGSCLHDPAGFTDTIAYNIHEFNNLAHYHNGNKFEVQLIQFTDYPPSFYTINTGLLGVVIDTLSGNLLLHVPCSDTLNANGINPGVYYMRIIADSSNYRDSSLGSLVYLTIGEPSDSMYLTVSPAGPYCTGATITIYTNPDNQYSPYNSTYTWWSIDKLHGTQPFANWTYGYLAFYDNYADTMLISCQENNNGCLGPIATITDSIIFIGPPNIHKTGPTRLCIIDTGLFSIPFAAGTTYHWEYSGYSYVDNTGNMLKIRFSSAGTKRISVVAYNQCYTDSAVWSVVVDTNCLLAVQNIMDNPHVSVYPNPSAGQFTFTFDGGNYSGSRLEVYNVLGEMVKNEEIKNKTTMINLGSNPNGVYYYKVICENGIEAGRGKLIIEK